MSIKFNLNDIYHMTYYASYMNSEDVVEVFNEKLDKYKSTEDQILYKTTISEISENLTTTVSDEINEIIFDRLLAKDYSIYSISKIKDLVSKINHKDYEAINKMLNNKLEDIRYEKDILSLEEFTGIVNEDLAINGLDSQWIFIAYEYRKLDDSTKYVEINPYLDKFDAKYKDLNEVYESLFFDYRDEVLKDYLNPLSQIDDLKQNDEDKEIEKMK